MSFNISSTPPAQQECRACLYKCSHPFGLSFDNSGLCTGCITHQEKFDLDWDARFLLLEEKIKKINRNSRNRYYDCIVPVRGTPEHFYVLDVVKNRLGLNPLVVSYNSQFNSRVGIMNLDRLRDVFDVDILVYTSNPVIYKKLVRESLMRLNNMRWPYLAGETSFAVQVAVERSVPLIIWPWHQPTEQSGMHSYTETPEMSRRNWADFDLMGVEPGDFCRSETIVIEQDVLDIRYPEDHALLRSGVRGVYLSNYLPWDSRRYSEEMISRYGALGAYNSRTFDTYDRIDDMTYMTIHDVLKFANLGHSRVTDNLCREIRFGRISKADAKQVELFFQNEYPVQGIERFLDWLGMTKDGFIWYLDRSLISNGTLEKTASVLTESQKVFVDSFLASGPDVVGDNPFIVYGKGLRLENPLID